MRLLFLKLTLLLLALFCVAGLSFVTMLDSTNLNDRARVLSGIVDLQIAGLRLAASQLQVMDEAQQATWLSQQSQIWRGPLSVCDIADLPVKDAVVLRSADGSLCQYQDGFVLLTVAFFA
jgi:hypothetical protein